MIRRLIDGWTGLWSREEPPIMLALMRIGLALVMLYDLLQLGRFGLPGWLWADRAAGGLWALGERSTPPDLSRLVLISPEVAWAIWGALVVSIAAFGAGLATRLSGVVFVLLYAQTAMINDPSDRAIDRLVRIVVLVLVFSRAGDMLSVDARRRTGSWWGSGAPAPSWPRYLIVLQLVVVYWGAGVAKGSIHWFPWGDYNALYLVLQDPIFATRDWSGLLHPVLFLGTQVGTAVTHMWENLAPLLLLAFYYRDTEGQPGRLRALFNRLRFRDVFVLLGAVFHLLLAGSLLLGIFPFMMLAMYPAFFHPDELGAVRRWWASRRVRSTRSPRDSATDRTR